MCSPPRMIHRAAGTRYLLLYWQEIEGCYTMKTERCIIRSILTRVRPRTWYLHRDYNIAECGTRRVRYARHPAPASRSSVSYTDPVKALLGNRPPVPPTHRYLQICMRSLFVCAGRIYLKRVSYTGFEVARLVTLENRGLAPIYHLVTTIRFIGG